MTRSIQMDRGSRGRKRETILFGMRADVVEVALGVGTLKVTLERVKEEMTGTTESRYDSATDKEPAQGDLIGRVMSALVGTSFEMKLKETGEVMEVSGFSATVGDVLKGIKDEAALVSHVKRQFNDDELKEMLGAALPTLPREKLVEGGAWTSEGAALIHMLGSVPSKSRSQLTSISGDAVEFRTRTRFDFVRGDSGGAHGRVEVWASSAEGTGTWDAAHGRLTEFASSLKVVVDAHGQEIEMAVTTTMRSDSHRGGERHHK